MQFPPRSLPLILPGGFPPNICLQLASHLTESQGWGTSKGSRHKRAPLIVVTTFVLYTKTNEKNNKFVSINLKINI